MEDYTNSQRRNPPEVNKSHLNQSLHLVWSVRELEKHLGQCWGWYGWYFPVFSLSSSIYLWHVWMQEPMSQTQRRCSYVQTLMVDLVTMGCNMLQRERTGHDSSHLHFKRPRAVLVCLCRLQTQSSVTGWDTDLCLY